MSDTEAVILVRDGRRGELVLNREDRRNAVNGPLVDAFRGHLATLVADPGIGAIVIRGAGGVFCSGLDLKDMNADPAPAWRAGFQDNWMGLHRDVYECPKPIVAAVEAYAINAGAGLALGADLLVMASDAFLQVGETRQGVAAPANLVWLRLKASRAAAAEIALLGGRLPASHVHRLGLAYAVVDPGAAVDEARRLADELASLPPEGALATKAVMRALDAGPVTPDSFRAARQVAVEYGRRGPLPSLKGSAG